MTFTTHAKTLATVSTTTPTNISYTTATVGGNIVNDGGSNVTARGIVYSTSQNPTTENSKVANGSGTGTFSCELTDLKDGTTYYARAYATNEKGTAYGEEISFTTKSINSNGHDYVDLGLPSGILWATCNIGANTPEEYGSYFAWAISHINWSGCYNWVHYEYSNSNNESMKKYCTDSKYGEYGFKDDKTTIESIDDAAAMIWGGNWRIPTKEEWSELENNCTWIWTTLGDIKGYKVTSKKNSNSIFLPAAGYKFGTQLKYENYRGAYWSSSLCISYPCNAYSLEFIPNFIYGDEWHNRCDGLSIRAVCQ